MNNRQSGFTMIELIVVIVILGILAATALPKFIDLRNDAVYASTKGMAGALSSAASLNYAGCSAVNNLTTGSTNGVSNANKCVTVTKCSETFALIQGGATSVTTAGYSTTDAAAVTSNGTTVSCTLSYTDPNNSKNLATASFTAITAGN